MEPLISIVIPIFNEKSTILATIKSLLSQSYTNFEILIIDDASTDSSLKIIEKISKKDKRIKIFETNGEGMEHAKNIGLAKSKGTYIMFFKSGYILEKSSLEHLIKLSQKYSAQIASLDFISLPEHAFYFQDLLHIKYDTQTIKIHTFKDYMKNFNTLNSHNLEKSCILWNKLFDKSIFENFSFPENLHYTDYKSLKSLYSKANRIVESNIILIKKFLNDDYLNTISFNYGELEYITFMQDLLVDFKKAKNTAVIKNTAINILKVLYFIRKQLTYYYLEIYDQEEQCLNLDKKFNSIKNFLSKNYAQYTSEFNPLIEKYTKLYKREKLKEKHPALFSEYVDEYENECYLEALKKFEASEEEKKKKENK